MRFSRLVLFLLFRLNPVIMLQEAVARRYLPRAAIFRAPLSSARIPRCGCEGVGLKAQIPPDGERIANVARAFVEVNRYLERTVLIWPVVLLITTMSLTPSPLRSPTAMALTPGERLNVKTPVVGIFTCSALFKAI